MPMRRLLLTVTVVLASVVGPGTVAALAHPFGPPLTADVSRQGATIEVRWSGAEDDWMALGEATGAFAAASDPARTGAEILADSATVRDYLLDNVSVHQEGSRCAAEWVGIDDLLEGGAHLRFRCPQPGDTVELTLTALTDVNQAYRTVVTAGGEQILFTATESRHALDLTGASGGGGQTGVLLLSCAGAALLAGGLVWGASARRGRGAS